MRVIGVAVLGLLLAGCYDWRAEVSRQASFDHSCPVERVRVIADNGDQMARAVRLDVCGRPRMYRDIGGTRMYLWQDVTEMTSGGDDSPTR